jgi:hypothetical protein
MTGLACTTVISHLSVSEYYQSIVSEDESLCSISLMENIYYVTSAHYVINIRVGFNTFKGKGIMVISHKRIFIC